MYPPRVLYQSPRLRGAMTEVEANAFAYLSSLERSLAADVAVILAAPPPAAPPPVRPGFPALSDPSLLH